MNLLQQYIPEYSGHIESLRYYESKGRIEVVFFDRPEEFNPVLKLVLEGVSEYSETQIDTPEENCIELVIGLGSVQGGYCLHSDLREVNFKASEVVSFDVST